MFYLKHVTTDGNEELHVGTSPTFISASSFEGKERGNAVVHYTDEKSIIQTIRWGKVYVMTEAGRTIATYDMGSPSIVHQVGGYSSFDTSVQHPLPNQL